MRQKIENYIKCLGAALLTAAVALLSGCVDEELPDNRDLDYGYVQFRLLKEKPRHPRRPRPKSRSWTIFPMPAR